MNRELVLLSPYRLPTHHPLSLNAAEAAALLNGYLALWHPAALRGAGQPPRLASPYDHEQPTAGHVYAVPDSPTMFLPDDWPDRLTQVGAVSFQATADRAVTVRNLLDALTRLPDAGPAPDLAPGPFLGLGLGYVVLEALFEAMDHLPQLAVTEFWADVTHALEAADTAAALPHLKAAAEKLHQAREVLYPNAIQLVDLVLWDAWPAEAPLPDALAAGTPVNLIVSGERLKQWADARPADLALLQERVRAGAAEVISGPWRDREDALLPVPSQLWNLRRGLGVCREVLGEEIQVHGRRRSAATPHLPSLLAAAGIYRTLLLTFDEGVAPAYKTAVIAWASDEGRTLEAFTHAPKSAADPNVGLHLAHYLSKTLLHDYTAGLTFLHPGPEPAAWYGDWLELHRLAPVYGQPATLRRFLGEVPAGEYPSPPAADEFHSNYLHDLYEHQAERPVSRFAEATRARAQLDAARTLAGLYRGLVRQAETKELGAQLDRDEAAAEEGAKPQAAGVEEGAARLLADKLTARAAEGTPGFLVLNPCSFPRRIGLDLPGVKTPLPAPARASQVEGDGAKVVVEVPALGFAWVPQRVPSGTKVPVPRGKLTDERVIRNDYLEAEIDAQTGGLRAIRDVQRHAARLGQQLVFAPGSRMKAGSVRHTATGPAFLEITSTGTLTDDHDTVLAQWEQRFRLWWGRPLLEIAIDLRPTHLPSGYPWHAYFGARFAWRDETARLVRGVGLRTHPTTHPRPEAPDFLEIQSGPNRTAVLTGGLPFLQRQGPRMLDVVLIPEREPCRTFRLALGVDLEEPAAAAQDWLTPPVAVPTAKGPPHVGASGWLFHLDAPNLLLLDLRPAADGADAVEVRLVECRGIATEAELRCARDPKRAVRIDLFGREQGEWNVSGDAVKLSCAAFALVVGRIEFA